MTAALQVVDMLTAIFAGAHKLPYFNTIYKQLVARCAEFRVYFEREIGEHQRQLDSGEVGDDCAEDFVFLYLNEIRRREQDSDFT